MKADKIFKINDEIEIHCYSRGNKYGFTHRAVMVVKGQRSTEAKCQYYNRTWERFQFESVLNKVLAKDKFFTSEQIHMLLNGWAEDNHKEIDKMFGGIAMVAMMGEVFGKDTKEKNDWKERMLKAGLGNMGLEMPPDWNDLDEETKQERLDAVIKHLNDASTSTPSRR